MARLSLAAQPRTAPGAIVLRVFLFLAAAVFVASSSSSGISLESDSPSCMFDWLESAGIPRAQAEVYAVQLGENRVQISSLPSLNRFMLRLLGISSDDHQRKILKCATTNCNAPCLNGGQCLNLEVNGSYHCQCAAGYVGERCKTDLCKPNPCLNGAPCSHNASAPGFRCSCRPGFEGTKCETMINLCKLKKPCKNGGKCTPLVNDFKCECLPTFHGKKCHSTWISRHGYEQLKTTLTTLRENMTSVFTNLYRTVQFLRQRSEWSTYNIAGEQYCYKLFVEKRTCPAAQARCKSFGADLASIHSHDEQQFLHKLAEGNRYWIGATDEYSEGVWTWMDGTPWGDYTNWNTHEPNGGSWENCVHASKHSNWNDYGTLTGRYNITDVAFVCKRRA